MNSYEILGIKPGATEEEVKAAYRALAQKYSGPEYQDSPMKEQAEAEMEKINAAFDEVMSQLRGGDMYSTAQSQTSSSSADSTNVNKWAEIRALINSGRVDEALNELNAIPDGASQAEWNFLVGSVFYYKGWLNEAMRYFSTACRLAPGNREYEAALHNLQAGQNGNMPNNPYGNYGGAPGGQVMGCSCCDMCTMMICMDACCNCCGGM